MITFKNKISGAILIFVILSPLNQARSQNSLNQLLNNPLPPLAQAPSQQANPPAMPTGVPQQAPAEEKKKKRFHFFWQNEQKERFKQEIENLKNRQKLETEEFKKKQEAEKVREVTLQKKVMEKQTEIMSGAQKILNERALEIKEIEKSNNTVEVVTNEGDPLYIKKAQVLKGKTNFLKIKDVDLKYRLELHNQTPKVINLAHIVWERKIAFNDTQTLAKEIKIAKPITPYEKRIFEYNELDSKRSGETYKVKVIKIVFEDGTQWKNPAVKDKEL